MTDYSLYKYTDKEIKELVKSMVILVDTREQQAEHITRWLDTNKIVWESKKLEAGDYSCYLPAAPSMGIHRNIYFTDIVAIERKASLNELSSNLTSDRNRIEDEFLRAKGKIYLLIENADYSYLVEHKYMGKYNPKAFIATLSTFEARYGIQTVYMLNSLYSASFIYNTLAYHVRHYLKG